MEGTSGVEAAETEAESQPNQSGAKSKKTPAQKLKHNEYCKRHRAKKKRRHEELEQEVPKLQAEHKKMKMELVETKSKFQVENKKMEMELVETKSKLQAEIQEVKRNLDQAKTAAEREQERVRRIITGLNLSINGQKISSLDELEEWTVSQNYPRQDGQVSATSVTGLQNVDEFVGMGGNGTAIFQPSSPDFYQQFGSGQDYSNIAAYTPAGPSSFANHAYSPSSQHGQDYSSIAAYTVAGSSSVANQGLPSVSDTQSSHQGVLTFAGSSLGANPEMVLHPTINNVNDDELYSNWNFNL